jgi:peptide/nickel transport system substrate-binding protein
VDEILKFGDREDPTGFTRRRAMQGAGTGILLVGGGSLLAACGGGSTGGAATGSTPAASEGTPVHGGVMTLGAQGGSNTDTLDAHNQINATDLARLPQLYNALIRLNNKGQPELELATALEPNKDATEWKVKLRKGVLFHDLTEFQAKDVLFSLNRIVKGKYPGALNLGPIDLANSKEIDPHTVLLKFSKPFAIFEEALTIHWYLYMVPVGYDPNKPIGTGPFKYVSFSPGRESVMTRFEKYWDHPKPYLDEVVTLNINDETAQVNALQAGQVNAIDYLSDASIATLESSGQNVIISESGGSAPFTMRLDTKPFDDKRVRQAFRLLVDREQMLQSVFGGNGRIGNDVLGIYDKFFDPSLFPQREQDIEQATSLLKAAGYSDLSVQLYTTPLASFFVSAAEVLKTQAEAAGVSIEVTNQPTTEFFARTYLKAPFAMDAVSYLPYFPSVIELTLKESPYNTTAFEDPTYEKYLNEAVSTLDENKQKELAQEMMKIEYDEGGYIIPMFFPVIDGLAPNVRGVEPSVTGQALSTFQFQNFWLEE